VIYGRHAESIVCALISTGAEDCQVDRRRRMGVHNRRIVVFQKLGNVSVEVWRKEDGLDLAESVGNRAPQLPSWH
jgi:hypothetical protein